VNDRGRRKTESLQTPATYSQVSFLSCGKTGRKVKKGRDESSLVLFVLLEQVWEENYVPICPLPLE
jgi:hypothetical protein